MNPDSLRAKWAVGIDEAEPHYSFIGIEGGTICWVENDDADAFHKVVEAHNATIDAWEADLRRLAEFSSENVTLRSDNAALRVRLGAEVRLQIEFRKGLLEQNGLVLTLNKKLEEAEDEKRGMKRRWDMACDDNAALREAIDAMLRECGSERDSRYVRNACIIGAAALASQEVKP